MNQVNSFSYGECWSEYWCRVCVDNGPSLMLPGQPAFFMLLMSSALSALKLLVACGAYRA